MRRIFTLLALAASLTLSAQSNWARVFTTTGDASRQINATSVQSTTGSGSLTVNTGTREQSVDGFGYAITYSACYNLLNMPAAERERMLKTTFSREEGYGVSYVRISIGCNDFSSEEYTLCDTEGSASDPMQHFRLHGDETGFVIPILKEILRYNPDLKIIGSPWTPPRWMKTNEAYKAGQLREDKVDAYAELFVRFVKAFQERGINIYAITPQNEPMNKNNSASCFMDYRREAQLVKAICGKFNSNGIKTLVYLWDHNYNYDDNSDNTDFPQKVMNQLSGTFAGKELIAGNAWHKYTGYDNDWQEMNDIYNKTRMDNLFTEASIGDWNDATDLRKSLARDMRDLVIHPSLARCRGSIVWNFALDTNHGPIRPNGGCTTCNGAFDLSTDGLRYTFTSHYYIMAHASLVVKPGAQHVTISGSNPSNVTTTAYVNPDNTVGLLAANTGDSNQTLRVSANNRLYQIEIPGRAVISAQLGLSQTQAQAQAPWFPASNNATADAKAAYYVTGNFCDWKEPGTPGSVPMTPNGDGTYSCYISTSRNGSFLVFGGTGWGNKYRLPAEYKEDDIITGNKTLTLAAGEASDKHNIEYFYECILHLTFNPQTLVLTSRVASYDEAYPAYVPGEIPAGTVIYFDNSVTRYPIPYAFTWGGATDNGWPGEPMTRVAATSRADEDLWQITVTPGHTQVLFNNGVQVNDAYKTADFVVENGKTYVGDTDYASRITNFTPLYISGIGGNWNTPGQSGSISMTQNNGVYTATVTLNGSGRFGIYGADWNPKYCMPEPVTDATTIRGNITLQLGYGGDGENRDIHYNYNGQVTMTFDPASMTLTVNDGTAMPEPNEPVVEPVADTSEPRYISGTLNNWPTPQNGNMQMVGENGVYSLMVNFNGEGRLGIYGANWSPKYCLTEPSTDATLINGPKEIQLQVATSTIDNLPTGQKESYDVHYNYNGQLLLTFDPTTLKLIVTDPQSVGIETIEQMQPVQWYDLNGLPVSEPTQGIYIRLEGKEARKVLVK